MKKRVEGKREERNNDRKKKKEEEEKTREVMITNLILPDSKLQKRDISEKKL